MLAKSPDIIESLKLVGVDANGGSPQEFSKALEMEINRFSKIILTFK